MTRETFPRTKIELAHRLLGMARIQDAVTTLESLGGPGLTNRMWLVSLHHGERFVLREYQWPYPEPDLDRPAKEAYLHHLLLEHVVPVARVVAWNDSATLMEFVPDAMLGTIGGQVPEGEIMPAWFHAGRALRQVHSIAYPPHTAGTIVGPGHVRPFPQGTWGRWVQGDVLRHARRLEEQGVVAPTQVGRIENIVGRAVAILDEVIPTLVHNDLHPLNILVRKAGDHFDLAALLDWEYAWVGDPVWDLVRFELWRPDDIGPTPAAFYDGYSSLPNPFRSRLYELALYLWRTQAQGHPSLARVDTTAQDYVQHLDAGLSRIEDLLPEG